MKLRIPVVILCLLSLVPAAYASAAHAGAMPRLRPATPSAQAIIETALASSETVRTLAAEIAASDLIVYVELAGLGTPGRAKTVFVTANAYTRFVRITLTLAPVFDLIPLLAHELQHAVEIARAPEVRDDDALRVLYARIGADPQEQHAFETQAARVMERKARKESFRKPR